MKLILWPIQLFGKIMFLKFSSTIHLSLYTSSQLYTKRQLVLYTKWQLVIYNLSWTVIGQPYCLHHDVIINATAPVESHVGSRPIDIQSRMNSRWMSRAEFCPFDYWLPIPICDSNGEVTNLLSLLVYALVFEVQWRLNLILHKVHLMCTWGARHL